MKYANYDHYTDENGVLLNKLGAKTEEQLESLERRLVAMQTVKLRLYPVQGNFDLTHLKAIHHRLFNDIYQWAGEIRDVGIQKDTTLFAAPDRIESEFFKLHHRLKNEHYLRNLPLEKLAQRLAYYLAEINIIHPFREGNGRSQREFIVQLARQAGCFLHFNNVSQQQMIEASKLSVYCDYSLLTQMLFSRLTLIEK